MTREGSILMTRRAIAGFLAGIAGGGLTAADFGSPEKLTPFDGTVEAALKRIDDVGLPGKAEGFAGDKHLGWADRRKFEHRLLLPKTGAKRWKKSFAMTPAGRAVEVVTGPPTRFFEKPGFTFWDTSVRTPSMHNPEPELDGPGGLNVYWL